MSTPSATGFRAGWTALPPRVRADLEAFLGSPVVAAVNQDGGFSPGLAARIRCADGRRAFVKAVGPELNPDTPDLHRAEARIAAALPITAPVPRFRHGYDDGDWVALVFDEVDGRMPALPWSTADLHRVLDALGELARSLTPCPLDDMPTATEKLRADMLGYRRLLDQTPDDLDPWELRHLPALAELAESALSILDGDTLVHLDVRADNVLLTDDRVMFVDWPWATRGAAWIDTAVLGVNAALHGHDPDVLLAGNPLLEGVDPTPLLAGLAGMWAHACRRPAQPGMPTIRAFQRAQGVAALDWVRHRTGWT
jgi:aminoglycoside phosphotransferase (APT) family kinase protein